ncbi:MAG TPA: LLM class F420-dependent oxidoreductase [Methylomirabilota bacterium]|nr:LLM class F420-dependent oxidoreductase [Methylomirabilota bacterium]
MKLGFSLPMAGPWATPQNQILVAQRAEALGYHSLWVFQRMLYPIKPQNDYPPLPGQPWPKSFERVMDPLVSLAFVAAVTSRIRLGTSVLIMPYYTPVMLAKQLATLDVVSAGRLDVGLGLGWSRDEFDAVGVPYEGRGKRADEFLRCLKAIWTEDPVEFKGEFYSVPLARVEPRPVQRPHPPITIGGYGSTVIRRAVTYDGFNGGNVPLGQVAPLVKEIKAAAEAAGRDPATLQIVSRGSFQLHATPKGPDRRPLWGSLAEIRQDVERYAEAGLTELFLEANFDPRGVTLEGALEVLEALAPGSGLAI